MTCEKDTPWPNNAQLATEDAMDVKAIRKASLVLGACGNHCAQG